MALAAEGKKMTDYSELKRLAEAASKFHSSGVEPGTYNPYQNDFSQRQLLKPCWR